MNKGGIRCVKWLFILKKDVDLVHKSEALVERERN